MNFNGFNISVRGYSHILKNTVCQDSSRFFSGSGFAVCAVSDGHGSEPHFRSDRGSEIAARTAIRTLSDLFARDSALALGIAENPEKTLRRIEANILLNWNEEVAAHAAFCPFSDDERLILNNNNLTTETVYGATLLVGVATSTLFFGFQLGDGGFLCLSDGDVLFPVPDDLRLVANFTTSLCDSDAISEFRHFCIPAPKNGGLFLCTDGLVNSFSSEKDYIAFAKRVFAESAAESRDELAALSAHLAERSEKGSRDDISLAVATVGE